MIPLPAALTLAEVVGVILVAATWAATSWIASQPDRAALVRWRRRARLVAVGVGVLVVYLANGMRIPSADAQPAAFAAVSLVRHGDLTLDEFRPLIDPLLPFTVTSPAGHVYSMYPPGTTFAAAPFFAIPVLVRMPMSLTLLDALAKLAAACWTALSAVLLLAALDLYAPRAALLTTIAYAFGTTAFSSAAQDLWQHGPSQAGLALCLLLLARGPRGNLPSLALGAAMGWAVLCRTSDLLPVLVLLLFVLLVSRRAALLVVVGALPAALVMVGYNWVVTGLPWLLPHVAHRGFETFSGSPLIGLAGLLVAPSRGLLVYSPFLLLALPGAALELKRRRREEREPSPASDGEGTAPLAVLGVVAALSLLVLVAQWGEWPGGWSYGYRIVSEVALLLMPAVALAAERVCVGATGRAVVMAMIMTAIAIQSLQVFFPNDVWNANVIGNRQAPAGVWSVTPGRTQIGTHLRYLGAWLRRQPRPSDEELRHQVEELPQEEAR